MFFNALYCFGFLPKAIQLIALVIFFLVTIRTLKNMNSYETEPCILIIGFYFFRRMIEWLVSFKIQDWTLAFRIIFLIAFLVFLIQKIKFWGILICLLATRLMFIFNNELSIFYSSIITTITIIFLKTILNFSNLKLLTYIVLGILIGIFGGPVISIEAIILIELLIRCIVQNELNGLSRFISLFISMFTFAYLIELAFAHTSVMILLFGIIWLLKKAIS